VAPLHRNQLCAPGRTHLPSVVNRRAGAGNSGIGTETVRALAVAGARVVFTSRSLEAGEAVAADLRKDPRVKAGPGRTAPDSKSAGLSWEDAERWGRACLQRARSVVGCFFFFFFFLVERTHLVAAEAA